MRDVGEIIRQAREYTTDEPSSEAWREVMIEANALLPWPDHAVAVWTYHVTGNENAARFQSMIDHQREMTRKFIPDSWHIQTNGRALNMFERCASMCAYVHSRRFTAPTVFLDSDAFPNGDLRRAFDQITDVGLTVREELGLMPVNEGVIFARPTDATRAFFKRYLATYENLSAMMGEHDWLWWGGQLALNAVADDRCARLDCDTYNFAPDMNRRYTREELDAKMILHAKGPRKVLFDQIVAYQEARCASPS